MSGREKSPFFIVGSGRSGTTLLSVLIDGHPNLAMPPEGNIYLRFGPVFASYGDLRERRNRIRLIDAMLRDVCIRRWRLDVTTDDVERRVNRPDRGGVIEALFALYAERQGSARWGEKMPEHFGNLPEVRADFPDGKLIHLVRDGRDVAEAFRRMIFGPVCAVGLARLWRREVMDWRAFCAERGTDNTLVLRYEDLVTAPRDSMGRVFQFLDEPYVDTVSGYETTALSEAMSGVRGGAHSSLRRGIGANKIGVYRQKFTRRDIEIFESVAGDALEAYGYEREFSAPRSATVWERVYGFFADRFVRWYRKLYHPSAFWQSIQLGLRRVAASVRLLRMRMAIR